MYLLNALMELVTVTVGFGLYVNVKSFVKSWFIPSNTFAQRILIVTAPSCVQRGV
jgi:hypothetical protein